MKLNCQLPVHRHGSYDMFQDFKFSQIHKEFKGKYLQYVIVNISAKQQLVRYF